MNESQNNIHVNDLVDPILSKLKTDPRYEEDNTKAKVVLDNSNAEIFSALDDTMRVFLNESGTLCRSLYNNLMKLNSVSITSDSKKQEGESNYE